MMRMVKTKEKKQKIESPLNIRLILYIWDTVDLLYPRVHGGFLRLTHRGLSTGTYWYDNYRG